MQAAPVTRPRKGPCHERGTQARAGKGSPQVPEGAFAGPAHVRGGRPADRQGEAAAAKAQEEAQAVSRAVGPFIRLSYAPLGLSSIKFDPFYVRFSLLNGGPDLTAPGAQQAQEHTNEDGDDPTQGIVPL